MAVLVLVLFVLMFMQDAPDTTTRVVELLQHVQNGDENHFKDFCKALKSSGQQHIVNMLYSNKAGGDTVDAVCCNVSHLPLTQLSRRKLSASWTDLKDNITSDVEFLSHLKVLAVFPELKITALEVSNQIW